MSYIILILLGLLSGFTSALFVDWFKRYRLARCYGTTRLQALMISFPLR